MLVAQSSMNVSSVATSIWVTKRVVNSVEERAADKFETNTGKITILAGGAGVHRHSWREGEKSRNATSMYKMVQAPLLEVAVNGKKLRPGQVSNVLARQTMKGITQD